MAPVPSGSGSLAAIICHLVIKSAPPSSPGDNEGESLLDRGPARLETGLAPGAGGPAIPRAVSLGRGTDKGALMTPLTETYFCNDIGDIRDPGASPRRREAVVCGGEPWPGRPGRKGATLGFDRPFASLSMAWRKRVQPPVACSPCNALDTDSLTTQARLRDSPTDDDDSTAGPGLRPADNKEGDGDESRLDSGLEEESVETQGPSGV